MGSTSRIGTRLVSRSQNDNIAASNLSTTSTRLQSRSSSNIDKPTFSYSLPLPFTTTKHSVSLPIMLRRYLKKLTDKDSSGKPSTIARLFTAFKMGLYFKVFITLILILRLASHSSQRSYPTSSVSRDDHFIAMSSAPISPNLRIIVMTESGYSQQLKSLLSSLSNADYDRDNVALDIWMFASSTCNYLLPLYPLAVAIFGPPRFDHSIPPVVQSINWPHGQKTLIAVRSEPNWADVWQLNRGTANETILFIDAFLTKAVSPAYYNWLKRARTAVQRGMVANAGVYSLDSVNIPDGVPASDRAVLLEQFFPTSAAFSPTHDVWNTFLQWYFMRKRSWFSIPRLNSDLSVGGYRLIESLRVSPVRAWFTQFLASYKERVVHPVLPENQSLILRTSGTTGYRMKGIGSHTIRVSQSSEYDANRYQGNLKDTAVPENPILIKSNGHVSTADIIYGLNDNKVAARTREAVLEDLVDDDTVERYREVLKRIGEFARSRGTKSISLTLTTESYLETTLSWLCNIVHLNIAPPAIVIVTNGEETADSLKQFTSAHPKLEQGSLIVSMEGSLQAFKESEPSKIEGNTSSTDHLALILHRTFLLRDLLERGISILQFEPDQVWLSDPMPYIEHELRASRSSGSQSEHYGAPDVVVTINNDKEIVGNFLYLRPTVSTRKLLSIIVNRFFLSYQNLKKNGKSMAVRKYMANDQSLLTNLMLGKDHMYSSRYPAVKYSILNDQLFVDGRWFSDFEDENGKGVKTRRYYRTETSLYPVVLNNNFVNGVKKKMERAKRFGFWFLKESSEGSTSICNEEAVIKAAQSGSIREHREAPVIELG